MEKTSSRGHDAHVVVLAYPAQGHINPLLQFAKRLSSKGLKTTFATTPYTIHSIHADGVHVKPISDGFDDGGFKQAPSVEAYINSFKTAGSRTLTELILNLNEDSPVACLVYDSLLPWALDVARRLGIYGAALLTNSASVCSMYWHIHQDHVNLPVVEPTVLFPGLPLLGVSDIPSFLSQPVNPYSAYLASIMEKFSRLDQNDWVFVNTFEELESQLAKAMFGLWPVEMVGPLVPSAYLDEQIDGDTDYGGSLWKQNSDQCLKWLDNKPPKSVIFVSFGSMAHIAVKQVEEIAWGLQGSNKHFIWVVRRSENEKIPVEFLNAIEETGLIVEWCNQLEVLAHEAVSCFVTHCGWNSTLEALSLGVPMVSMPQWSDQPTNAMFVEKVWRVGVRVRKDIDEGIVSREELKMCIKNVMVGEKSVELRREASKWKDLARGALIRGGSSDKNIDRFVEVLLKGKGMQS